MSKPLEIFDIEDLPCKDWEAPKIKECPMEKWHEGEIIKGNHAVVKGEKKDIIKWLAPFNAIYKGVGSPMMQKFEVVHIKPELITQ